MNLAGEGDDARLVADDGEPGAFFAPDRMRQGTWNLLLIAVRPDRQGEGVGAALQRHVGRELAARNARLLPVDQAEAELVRFIFRRDLALGSLVALQREPRQRGVTTRRRVLSSGRLIGGVAFTKGPLAHMLRNRTYLGEINHHGASHRGEHAVIVDAALFAAVQVRLTEQRNERDGRKTKSDALLVGRLFDDRGTMMTPSHALKRNVRHRYYASTALVQGRRAEAGAVARVAALDIGRTVVAAPTHRITAAARDDAAALRGALGSIELRVMLRAGQAELSWTDEAGSSAGGDDEQRHHVVVPFAATPHKRRRAIILPADAPQVRPIRAGEQQNLVRSIAQGRAWLQQIMTGADASTIAARERRSERMVRMTVSLAFLDPKLVQAIVQGSLPQGASMRRLIDAPASWHEPWQMLGLAWPA